MKLIKIEDLDGQPRYINPAYVIQLSPLNLWTTATAIGTRINMPGPSELDSATPLADLVSMVEESRP